MKELKYSNHLSDYQIIPFSAESSTSLYLYTDKLLKFISDKKNQNILRDLSYTLQTGRRAHSFRTSLVVEDETELFTKLKNVIDTQQDNFKRVSQKSKPRIAFIYNGQGNQYIEMGLGLYNKFPAFRKSVDECSDFIKPHYPVSFTEYMFNPKNKKELNNIHISSVALFILEYATTQLYKTLGVTPHIVLGHSLGEYTAACIAGNFEVKEALNLLVFRGKLMEGNPRKGTLLAINGNKEQLNKLSEKFPGYFEIATINSPNQYVLCGLENKIYELKDYLESKNILHKVLPLSSGSHSSLMNNIECEFYDFLNENINFNKLDIPLISNLSGRVVSKGDILDSTYWSNHLKSTVNFYESTLELIKENVDIAIEIGPNNTLTTLIESYIDKTKLNIFPSIIKKESNVKVFYEAISSLWEIGSDIDWKALNTNSLKRRIHIPTYAFDLSYFWINEQGKKRKSSMEKKINNNISLKRSIPTTRELVSILWSEVLGVKTIKDSDNFFELVGESLHLIQVQSSLRRNLNFTVDLQELYRHPTYKDLVHYLTPRNKLEIVQSNFSKDYKTSNLISHIQKMILDLPNFSSKEFFLGISLETNKKVSIETLKKTYEILLEKHKMIRATYNFANNSKVSRSFIPMEYIDQDIMEYDLSLSNDIGYEINQVEKALVEKVVSENQLLSKIALVKLSDYKYRVIWVISHLNSDSYSKLIIERDFIETYTNLNDNGFIENYNSINTNSYDHWLEKCKIYANSDSGKNDLNYWREIKSNIKDCKSLVQDLNEPYSFNNQKTIKLRLTKEQTYILKTEPTRFYKVGFKEILYTLVSRALCRWGNSSNIVFSVNGHGRETTIFNTSLDLSDTVGFFVNNYPFLLKNINLNKFEKTLEGIIKAQNNIPLYGNSFNILKYMREKPDAYEIFKDFNLPDILVNYQGDSKSTDSIDFEWKRITNNVLEQPLDSTPPYKLSILGNVLNNQLNIELVYVNNFIKKESINRLKNILEQEINQLITHKIK